MCPRACSRTLSCVSARDLIRLKFMWSRPGFVCFFLVLYVHATPQYNNSRHIEAPSGTPNHICTVQVEIHTRDTLIVPLECTVQVETHTRDTSIVPLEVQ